MEIGIIILVVIFFIFLAAIFGIRVASLRDHDVRYVVRVDTKTSGKRWFWAMCKHGPRGTLTLIRHDGSGPYASMEEALRVIERHRAEQTMKTEYVDVQAKTEEER